MSTTNHDFDFYTYFTERRQIVIIWSIDDVQYQRPDLTDDQAWEVLQACDASHDCEIGLSWDIIGNVTEELFPHHAETEKGA